MDLSKAFDCLPHDLLLAKLEAYGFDLKTLNLFFSYLRKRRQYVNINGTISDILEIISGVPQGSKLGPILFNIFMNDFIQRIKSTNTHDYADDNTLSVVAETIKKVINLLEKGASEATHWLDINYMIANVTKFHAIIATKDKQITVGLPVKVGNIVIKTEDIVKLLGVS